MRQIQVSVFLFTSCLVLFITGTAKLISAFGDAEILRIPDLLFGIPYRYLFCISGALELLVVTACWLNPKKLVAVGLIGWLAVSFSVYRMAIYSMGQVHLCPCLGNLTDSIRVAPHTADLLLKISLAFMLVGSFTILVSCRRLRTND
jgi:hypothetical protein